MLHIKKSGGIQPCAVSKKRQAIEPGKLRVRLLFATGLLFFITFACNMPVAPENGIGTPTGALDVLTLAAQTAQVGQTPQATNTAPAVSEATQGPPATATNTGVPPTATPQPCDAAQFISDVTIPDGTKMIPAQAFTKTWRLRNLGTCTWNNNYALVFSGGDAMGAPAVVNLPGSVPSGATVDVSVDMKAPSKPGKYQSNWKLRNPAGVVFGVFQDQPFFVQIEVLAPTNTPGPSATPRPTSTYTATPTVTLTPPAGVVYDFTASYCSAQWRSQAGVLNCPGIKGDAQGYEIRPTPAPQLENGLTETRPVLLTVPDISTGGAITGQYPAQTIQGGQHFLAAIGCLNGATQCNVVYQLNVISGGGQPANLGQWPHTYNGTLQNIDVDLSSLAGQQAQLILAVINKGAAEQAQAVWVNPHIEKSSAYP